jgi:hypothetical protein
MTHRPAGALAALMLGCSSSTPPATAPLDDKPVDSVMRWALGPTERAPRPRSGHAYLLLLPASAADPPKQETPPPPPQGTRVTEKAIPAESFLPAPPGESRFFFAASGRVTAGQLKDGRVGVPTELEGADPALKVTHLLGFMAAASPLRLLVSAKPDGSARNQLWLFTVADRSITAADQVSDHPAFRTSKDFFNAFRVPRCLSSGQRCLVLEAVSGQVYLEVEPARDKPPELLLQLGRLETHDAAWASADGRSLYLLAGCPSPGDKAATEGEPPPGCPHSE